LDGKSFLGGLPQYRLVKSVAEGFAQIENAENLKPVLVNIEEGWQIGYLLESLQTGWVVVFVPQAPTPMSGNVMYLPEGRVRPLAISMVDRKAHGDRFFEGSCHRESCASQGCLDQVDIRSGLPVEALRFFNSH
jgi:hypothetical protein